MVLMIPLPIKLSDQTELNINHPEFTRVMHTKKGLKIPKG